MQRINTIKFWLIERGLLFMTNREQDGTDEMSFSIQYWGTLVDIADSFSHFESRK